MTLKLKDIPFKISIILGIISLILLIINWNWVLSNINQKDNFLGIMNLLKCLGKLAIFVLPPIIIFKIEEEKLKNA